MQQHDVFISYTQPDRDVAAYIHDVIQNNHLSSWVAPSTSNGIAAGRSFESQVVRAISNSKVFVLVYSDYCNHSGDVLQEIRNRNKKHPTIIIRLDDSAYCEDLSFHLKDVQYIDADRNDLQSAANILLRDIARIISGNITTNNRTTDQLLFYKGVGLLKDRNYTEATKVLQQHSGIAPDSCDTGFYLSLAIIAGKKIKKLNGLQVRTLEDILLPHLSSNKNTGFINVLLAMIKQGYYIENGFIVPEPGIAQLIDGITLSAEKAAAMRTHLNEPEHKIWKQFLEKNNMS